MPTWDCMPKRPWWEAQREYWNPSLDFWKPGPDETASFFRHLRHRIDFEIDDLEIRVAWLTKHWVRDWLAHIRQVWALRPFGSRCRRAFFAEMVRSRSEFHKRSIPPSQETSNGSQSSEAQPITELPVTDLELPPNAVLH